MTYRRFNAPEYLNTTEARVEYLRAALETGDIPFIMDAVTMIANIVALEAGG